MRYFDNGSLHSVLVSKDEVYEFASKWPCSHFCYGHSVWFQFEKEGGDLVDVNLYYHGRKVSDEKIDGSAMLALSHDAQKWAEKKRLKKEGKR